jgi:hypothetical protein
MKIRDMISLLLTYEGHLGNADIVLYDLDTDSYFTLARENVEAQLMKDGSIRLSVGPNGYMDSREDHPKERPILLP